ncbi:MAG: zinc-binding dehydrogenase [Spirochaetaceae bacterium]|nr:MAG: zinc-binding dehydrogenase [Spirochaetaceae bacterium]
MKTLAVRLYGKEDLRLEEFDLPPIGDDEILAQVISDSICMSSYKAAMQGADHKRVPDDVDKNPTIIGHEMSGKILEVGKKWRRQFKADMKFSIQPALNYRGSLDAPGYSFRYIGGDATHVIIPNEVMEMNCLLPFSGQGYFPASLSEPVSCIAGAFHASFHNEQGSYVHQMGLREGGSLALLAAAGPMGLGALDYALHAGSKPRLGRPRLSRPRLIVVTDIDEKRLSRAQTFFPPEQVAREGVELVFCNTRDIEDVPAYLIELSGSEGFDDVFVFAPVAPVVETGDRILGKNGCLNFFAGPTDSEFAARVNFYNIHYSGTHVVGTTGGNTDDMIEALDLMSQGKVNPAMMVTHIGGLNAVVETTLNLPKIPGGKKLIYTNIEMDLTAIDDFKEKGAQNPLFARLAAIVEAHNGLWSVEAEDYLLANAKAISV